LTEEEIRADEDATWAQQDPDVRGKYSGEFVVPLRRTIDAHGYDAADVLAEASRVTGLPQQALPLVGILDPLVDVPH
jgi:hypothetical protein